MFKTKKMVSLLLVLCMVLALTLTACNAEPEETTDNSETLKPTEDASTPEPANELEPVTLKWLIGGAKQKDSEKVWEEWNKKLQEEFLPNTTVEFEPVPFGEYKERWDLMMQGGEQVDIAWTGWVIPYAEEVAKGAYLPLNDLIKDHAPDLTADLPEWVLNIGAIDGVIYSIPNFQQMVQMSVGMRTPTALAEEYWDVEAAEKIIQEDINSGQFRRASMVTYNEVEKYLKALKDAGKLQLGINFVNFNAFNAGVDFPGQTKMRIANKGQEWDYTIRPHYEFEENKEFNDVLHDWYNKGYIRQDWLTLDNPSADNAKEDGYIAWFHANFKGQSERETLAAGFPVTVVAMESEYYIASLSSSTSTAIPRTSVNPERAIKVLELMHTDKGREMYNMLVWGLEGEHYEKVTDNRIKTLHYDGSQAPDDAPYGLPKWAVGNTFKVWGNQADPDGWNEYLEEVHENAVVVPFMGFKPDTSMIQNELAQVSAASAEFANIFVYPDYEERWEQMVEKLKVAGIEKIADEMQRQLDSYMQAQGIQ